MTLQIDGARELDQKVPLSLHKKILAANEKIARDTFPASHYDPIKPAEVNCR